jgi:hypothetical protein
MFKLTQLILIISMALIAPKITAVSHGKSIAPEMIAITPEAITITSAESLSVVTIENGVIISNTARTGKVCADNAYVYGSPQEIGEPLHLLSIGTQIEIRELSRNTPEPWAMIEPAKWLKMSALCGNK